MLAAEKKCGKKCWPHSTCAVRKIGRRQKVRYHRTSTLRCDRNTKVRPEMTAFLPMRSLWPHLCIYGMAAISTLSPFSAVLTGCLIVSLMNIDVENRTVWVHQTCVRFLRSLLGCILHWLRISYDCNVYRLPVNYIRTPIVHQLVKILLPQEKRINGRHLGT